MSKENGGPAFSGTQYAGGVFPSGHSEGMSLRDHFAGLAAQGLTSNMEWLRNAQTNYPSAVEACAMAAYELADAMLLERAK